MPVVRMIPFFAVVLTTLVSSEPARACSCLPALPVRAEVESSEAVFIGEVIAKRDVDVVAGGPAATVGYTFRVYRAWKGVRTETVDIGTTVSGMSCGSHFFVGDEYLVYAGGDGIAGATSSFHGAVVSAPGARPSFWTSACSRTMPIDASERDLEELGEPSFINDAVEVTLLSDELRLACREGETDAVRALIRAGHDVNGKDRPTGASALIIASARGHTDTVRALLQAGARVNELRRDATALTAAIASRHVGTVNALIQAGADVNDVRVRPSPLVLAVLSGELPLARALVDAGARPLGAALVRAAERGEAAAVDLLLENTAFASEVEAKQLALVGACAEGHLDIVERLVRAGVDVNGGASGSRRALEAAAYRGRVEIAQRLLVEGAEVTEKAIVAAAGHAALLELFLRARSEETDEPLVVTADMLVSAAYARDEAALERLLAGEVDVDARDRNGETALVVAAITGQLDAARRLLEAGADADAGASNRRESTPLMVASSEGHTGVMKLLIEHGADVNAGARTTALIRAAESGRLSPVRLLLASGADVNRAVGANQRTALSAASSRGHVTIVRTLLDAGADVGLTSALCGATDHRDLELVSILLGAKAPVNGDACSPLATAASTGRLDLVMTYLDAGADVTRTDETLHNAADRGAVEIVRVLIERGMDPNTRSASDGLAPLHHAVLARSPETVQVLLAAGADVDARAEGDTTPLMYGVPFHRRHVLEREERRRRDPEWVDPQLVIIELLLDAGADVDSTDQSGRTALARAQEVRADAIAALIRERMH